MMRFLAVNRQGFASLYMLAILQIIAVFCVLLLSSASSISHVLRSEKDLHHAQLAAIYRVKQRLQEAEDFVEEEKVLPDEEDIILDDVEEPKEPAMFLLSEETFFYEGIAIDLTYDDTQVQIQIDDLYFTLLMDPSTRSIRDLVYS